MLKRRKLILKSQQGNSFKRLDINGLISDPDWKNYKLKINRKNIEIIQDSMKNRNMKFPQRVAILTNIISENGGDTTPHGNGAYGLLGWRGGREKGIGKILPKQIHKVMEDIYNNKQSKEWTHGGKGTGVQSGKEMHQLFINTENTSQATNAFTKGYVRPSKEDIEKRSMFAKLIRKYMK